jgi:hypothetical protein
MNRKVLLLSLVVLLCCLYAGLNALDPFGKRLTHLVNHKDFYGSNYYINQDGSYYYTDTEPALLDSINLLTINDLSSGYSEIYIHSEFTHTYQFTGNGYKVEYHEYRNQNPVLYAYYMFAFNHNGDLVESIQERPSMDEKIRFCLHYNTANLPDSIYYYNTTVDPPDSYYKLFYNNQNRLQYSYRYMYEGQWQLAYRYLLTYNQNPYHYPKTLDFTNYRFYVMNGGGFEDSCPIFDQNYAPESIAFQYNDGGGWVNHWSSFYDVEVNANDIALINGQYNNYTGRFYFSHDGIYTHKQVIYQNLDEVNLTLTWSDDNPNLTADEDEIIPEPETLITTYPNPFLNSITIRTNSRDAALGDISIYNIKGQLIRSWKSVRANELTWDGKDNANKPVSKGIYLIKANQGKQTSTLKVIKL